MWSIRRIESTVCLPLMCFSSNNWVDFLLLAHAIRSAWIADVCLPLQASFIVSCAHLVQTHDCRLCVLVFVMEYFESAVFRVYCFLSIFSVHAQRVYSICVCACRKRNITFINYAVRDVLRWRRYAPFKISWMGLKIYNLKMRNL